MAASMIKMMMMAYVKSLVADFPFAGGHGTDVAGNDEELECHGR